MPLKSSEPLTLPCGATLPNRLVKAAMAESLAVKLHPGPKHKAAYQHWAHGGWGAVLTGNIMVDDNHLGQPGDVAITGDDAADIAHWRPWVEAAQQDGTAAIAQLNHPGRQSPVGAGKRGFFANAVAPSPIALNLGDNWIARVASAFMYGTPREMTVKDIEETVEHFAHAAWLASEAGFKGVEIHAAHGYLLSQFLSSTGNTRTDVYGGSPASRALIVQQILRAIRARVPRSLIIGIKVNSADFQSDAELEATLAQLELIAAEGIDFIELSGGSYEDPRMLASTATPAPAPSARTQAREGFFLRAGAAVRARLPRTLVLLTGGFRSREGIERALADGACDLAGLGRPSVKFPHLPTQIVFNEKLDDERARFDVEKGPSLGWLATKIRAISAGAETLYYGRMIATLDSRL